MGWCRCVFPFVILCTVAAAFLFYLWIPPLLFDLGAIGFGDLAARLKHAPGAPPRLLFGISGLLAASLIAMPFAGSAWQAVAIISISVCGSGGLYALTVSDAYARIAPSSVSMAAGMIACAQSIVFIIMNPLIGHVVDVYGHYDGIAIVIGLTAIPFTLLWILWKPRQND